MAGPEVELRVHGVSGVPPETLLGVPAVVQVAGDRVGRFFRPADGRGAPLPAADGRVLEGYHWGLFTSGSWVQGLWFLLLPFGLVNLAAHALPAAPASRTAAVARAALRLLGLALTATLLLGAVQVLVDLVARQGPGGGRALPMALAVAAVLGVLVLLTVLGRGRVAAAPPGPRPPVAPDAPATVLTDPAFYRGDPDVPVLRRVHAAAGLGVVGLPAGTLLGVPWLPAAVLGAAALLVVAVGDPRAPARRFRRGPVADGDPGSPAGPLAAALVVVAVGTAVVPWALVVTGPAARRTAEGPLAGTAGLTAALVAVGTGCLLVLLAADVLMARHRPRDGVPRPFRPLAGGLSAWVLASLGADLGVGFTAGLAWGTRRAVGGELPELSRGVAAAWGVAVLVLLLGGLAALAGRPRGLRRAAATAAAAYGPLPVPAPALDALVRTAAAARWRAGLRRWVSPALVAIAVLGAVSAAVLLAGVAGLDLAVPGLVTGALVAVGTVALVGFAVGLLVAGRGAVLQPAVRRGVNVLWDVVAFWPREVHPVVPPPYSQRAVADVAARVVWHLTEGGAARVVLAGHSQGSLLCVAALLHLPPELRPRVALLTHGSQLQIAYARVFPAAVPVALLRWVLVALEDRWLDLFRDTDPVGGPVLSWDRTPEDAPGPWTSTRLRPDGEQRAADRVDARGTRRCGPDWRLLDPAVTDAQREPWPGPRGHADATADPVWPAALAAVWPGAAPLIPGDEDDAPGPSP